MRWIRKRSNLKNALKIKIRNTMVYFLKYDENKENDDCKQETVQKSEITLHDESYTKFLDVYAYNTEANCELRFKLKQWFFAITMGILLLVTAFFALSMVGAFHIINKIEDIKTITVETILSVATIVLPSIVSLIVAFIKIPEIIAQYLFNVKEENSMQSVIKNIQDYDISRHKKDEMAEIIKMKGLDNDKKIPDNDQNFEDSPKQITK